jgi:hypothetical protein
MSNKDKNIVQESDAAYEKAETDLLREALKRTHKERFLVLTQFYKVQQTLQKAKITHRNSAGRK